MANKLLQRLLGTVSPAAGVDPTVAQTSAYVDARSSRILSVSFVLSGMTDMIGVTVTVQGSNETPPPGVAPGNWTGPSAASWYTLMDASGQPLSTTLAANGNVNLQSSVCAAAWVRATSAYVSGTGGSLMADVVGKTSD